jgi:hypothetical protein
MGWRAAFLLEGLLMLPFVVFAFASKPLHLTGSREIGPGKLWTDSTVLGLRFYLTALST